MDGMGMNLAKIAVIFHHPLDVCFWSYQAWDLCRLGFGDLGFPGTPKQSLSYWMNGNGGFSPCKELVHHPIDSQPHSQWMAMSFQVKFKQQRSQHFKGLTHFWCDFPSNFQTKSIWSHFAKLFNASKTCVQELCCGGISLYSPWQRGGGPAACELRDILDLGCRRLAVAKIRIRGFPGY